MLDIRIIVRRAVALSLGAGLIAATGSAAYAKDGNGDPKASTQQFEVKKTDDGKTKYCVEMRAVTGTRIHRKVCKTAKEWKDQGVTINAH
jgi:hypothetical protein